MSTINVKKILTDGREISINHTYGSTCLDDQVKATEKINLIIKAFEKNETPTDSKPEADFVHYNRTCKYCKGKNCVKIVTHHSGGSGKESEQTQEDKLHCEKCQKTWPLTSKASSTPTHDVKLLLSVQVIFRNARDKLYEENQPLAWARLSEVETKIIERIIYG